MRAATRAAVVAALVLGAACSGGGDEEDRSDPPETTAPAPTTTTAPVSSPAVTTPPPAPVDLPEATRADIEAALSAGAVYEARHLDEVGVSSMAFLDYVRRRWAIAGLEDARATPGAATDDPSERLLARLTDPDAAYPERAPGRDGSYWEHEVLVPALFCDKIALPAVYVDRLAHETGGGIVPRSHVAYAVTWTRELGCVVPGLDPVAEVLAAKLRDDLAAATEVTDDVLGAGAALGYLGRPDMVPPEWLARLLAAQQDDGGWPERPGQPSSWHSTGLALWTLAAATGPGQTVTMLPR